MSTIQASASAPQLPLVEAVDSKIELQLKSGDFSTAFNEKNRDFTKLGTLRRYIKNFMDTKNNLLYLLRIL